MSSYIEGLNKLKLGNPQQVVNQTRSKSGQALMDRQKIPRVQNKNSSNIDHPFADFFNKLYASNEEFIATTRDAYGNDVALSKEDIISQANDSVTESVSGEYDPYNEDYSNLKAVPDEVVGVLRGLATAESSNNPNVEHPLVKRGKYKGEKAIGMYGIMPGNVKSWTKEALGKSMSIEEFKKDPDSQELVVIHQLTKSLNKYGSIEDALSVWHSGKPLKKNKSVDVTTGLKTTDYVDKIMNSTGE